MKHLITIIPLITIFGFFLTGCEDSESGDSNADNNSDTSTTDTVLLVTTHDIDAAGAAGFYFDFIAGEETDSSDSWHISFQMLSVTGTTYKMPNLVLGDVYIAEYTNVSYDDLTTTPETFMTDYLQDPSVLQYGGTNEILSYDMQVHQVYVNNAERVFVLYEPINHTTYKIQFIEYVSGVTSFKYDAL